ncbi:aminotransferase class I/II-fold pyridoxal phosphate-dependent enzyme [Streptomyces flaveolus]|uniref:aminotransferase-like domain-containing protein n=1 Tax=Streptomyces flaveolus TaxID=67297 RepID=UPI003F53E874
MGGVDEGRNTVEVPGRGSDFLQLAVADVPVGGKAEWLAGRLRQAIADGRLAVGSRLPPTRVLAAELRVSRGVVTEAYRRLAEDGQVAGRRRGGTVVVAAPFTVAPGDSPGEGEEGVPGAGGAGWRESPDAGDARTDDPTRSPRSPWRPGPPAPPMRRVGGSGGSYVDQGANGPGRPHAGRREGGSALPGPGQGTPGASGPYPGQGTEEGGRPCPGRRVTGSAGPRPGQGTPRSPEPYPGQGTDQGGRPCAGEAGGPGTCGAGGLFGGEPGAEVFDALRAAPAAVDFTPGRPDLTTFPRAAWLRAERAVLAELSAEQLGYGDPRGAPRLRRAVADWLARVRGVRVEPDAVLIVAGTAQALTLLHPVLRADGVDAVAVEDPGSLGARQHLRNGGLATPPVPVDEEGVRVDALRATGARAVLLTPAHQFPTGVVTSGGRRRELLEWARDGGLILEDDYDAEHRYDRPPVPALRALLADRVCYLGSVSKLLAPALRIGWLVAPAPYRASLVDAKRFNDLGNAVLPQLVLTRLMESGELERHLRLLRGRHRRRRDAMIAALAEHLPGVRVHGAAAGLHLTVTYASDVPDTEFAAAALARGVKCQPLSWHRQSSGPPGLVLGYAATPPGVVAEAVALLGRTLRELA